MSKRIDNTIPADDPTETEADAYFEGYPAHLTSGGEDCVSDESTFPAGYLPQSDDYERAEQMAAEPEYSDDPVINAVCVQARAETDRILAEIDQFFVDAANVPLPLPEVTEEQRKIAQRLGSFELAPSPEDIEKFGGPLVAQQEQQQQEGDDSTDSSAYGRLLVKAIKEASATRNVYYFVRSGTQWVTSATYNEDSNCIQINTPRGPVSVHAREWPNLRDSHGRSIVASQALHGEAHAQQSPLPQEPEYSDDPVINAVCVQARKETDRLCAEIEQEKQEKQQKGGDK